METMTTEMVVYYKGENPITGKGVIFVKLEEDYTGNPSICISNTNDGSEMNLSIDELESITKIASDMIKQYDEAKQNET